MLKTNDAAEAFFGWLLGDTGPRQPANVIRLMFDPDGIRPIRGKLGGRR